MWTERDGRREDWHWEGGAEGAKGNTDWRKREEEWKGGNNNNAQKSEGKNIALFHQNRSNSSTFDEDPCRVFKEKRKPV